MRVGIIGSGRIGGNAGKLFARAGHEVLFSFSRDRAKLETLAEVAGNGARDGCQAHGPPVRGWGMIRPNICPLRRREEA